MFVNSWLVGQISHGPCPTLPGLFRLHLLFNTTSQIACLMWLCVEEQVFLCHLCVCVRREELSQFVDLWERRPKAALAKPSKAPSGSPGSCVTLLTKITFSPGPLSSPPVHFYSLYPFPSASKHKRSKVELWRLYSQSCYNSGFLKSLN